jgi:metallo-beta-lactamase family protein
MKITFHGAAQTVTGSQHLLEINGYRLLLECGLFQGRRKDTYERNQNFPFDPRKLDAVILSHAHIDHSGNLPNLIKRGYAGPIFTTPASAHLANIMLLDSAHVQESDAEYLNKKKIKRGEPLVEALYTQEDAAHVAQYFEGVVYHEAFEPVPGVTARLVEAGHMLGSAAVVLDIEERRKKQRLWFSGDIGRRGMPLLRDPELPDRADLLIMESTYGDKPHREPELAYEELRQVVGRTIARGGKVIVPAFAVGRTQELVYDLQQMISERQIPSIPVYVDSPLATNASEIYKAHPECFDDETWQLVSESHHPVLNFDQLSYTRSVEDSKALNDRKGPMVIIAASGMAEAGRILHHLKNNVDNPKNSILIVGWQAPDTLGRRIAEREKRIKIFDEYYNVRAEVATIGGLSAHAGQNLLLEYALAVKESVKAVYLVHGEAGPAGTLQGLLKERGMRQVHYPGLHEGVDIRY